MAHIRMTKNVINDEMSEAWIVKSLANVLHHNSHHGHYFQRAE